MPQTPSTSIESLWQKRYILMEMTIKLQEQGQWNRTFQMKLKPKLGSTFFWHLIILEMYIKLIYTKGYIET
jgi:hypothetical protein